MLTLNRDRFRNNHKELVIDVQPGVTYRIGAELDPDWRTTADNTDYWRPVVYREVPQPCR